jgi:predicted metal-binding protein
VLYLANRNNRRKKQKMKIGILRCDFRFAECGGDNCLRAIGNKAGVYSRYDKIELVAFESCGGCTMGSPDKIVKAAKNLKDKGVEVIHLCNFVVGYCPSKKVYLKTLRKEVGIPIVEESHGKPSLEPGYVSKKPASRT